MNIKQMTKEIKDKYTSIPEKQVSPGIYIYTVGRKHITLLNTIDETRLTKIPIKDFYYKYI